MGLGCGQIGKFRRIPARLGPGFKRFSPIHFSIDLVCASDTTIKEVPPSARVLAHLPQLRTGGILPRAPLALKAEGEPALFVVSQQPQPAAGSPTLPI